MMRNVLVTGGAGFLGSFLCEKLLSEGNHVICADNFYTGRMVNISRLAPNKNFELIRHDIIEPLMVEVDWIFNLACPASPVHYQANPIKTIKTNFMGAYNMLGLAKRLHAEDFSVFDKRGLRRSPRAPPEGNVLGACQSRRHKELL